MIPNGQRLHLAGDASRRELQLVLEFAVLVLGGVGVTLVAGSRYTVQLVDERQRGGFVNRVLLGVEIESSLVDIR